MVVDGVPNAVNSILIIGPAAVILLMGRWPERVGAGWITFAYIFAHFDGMWRPGDLIQDAIGLALFAPFAWRDRRYSIFWALALRVLTLLAGVFATVFAERVSWYAIISVYNVLGYAMLALLLLATWQARRGLTHSPVEIGLKT